MRLYLWILSRILTSYSADSPVFAYASVDASSYSALAETDLSLASSDSASSRVSVEQAHSLKEAFRPVRGLFPWFGLGKSGHRSSLSFNPPSKELLPGIAGQRLSFSYLVKTRLWSSASNYLSLAKDKPS